MLNSLAMEGWNKSLEKQKAESVLFINDSMFLAPLLPPQSFGFSAADLMPNLFYCFLLREEGQKSGGKNFK